MPQKTQDVVATQIAQLIRDSAPASPGAAKRRRTPRAGVTITITIVGNGNVVAVPALDAREPGRSQ